METLFWALSKIIWVVVSPSVFLFFMLLAGTLLLFTKRSALGSWLVATVSAILLIINIFPVGAMVMIPLEDRFPFRALPEEIDGIIVLGGAVEPRVSAVRGQPAVTDSAERLFAFIYLAHQYPDAKLVFAGGAGNLGFEYKHSDGARILFKQMGLDVNRVVFESHSRNTYENAVNSLSLMRPKIGEKWVLITSAFHMPRAVGVFMKNKWQVIPYPVDYQTLGHHDYGWHYDGFLEMKKVTYGLREWVGLFAYWVFGKTDSLFPKPVP